MFVITKLSPTKSGRMAVFFNGHFDFSVDMETAVLQNLTVGREFTGPEYDALRGDASYRQAREKAFRLLSYKSYTSAMLAQRLSQDFAPETVEDVIARVERLRKTQLGAFVIRTLEFLRKGGRIGLVEGVVGSLLQIKPVIYVNSDGVYNTLVKARGFSNALNAMTEEFVRRFEGRKVRIAIVHGAAYDEAVKLRERFLEKLDVVSSFISPVSPALAIHTGPGLLGAIVQYAD